MSTAGSSGTGSATLALARDLIRRQSVTPKDAGCQETLARRLRNLGFEVSPLPFEEVDNFWAIYGDSGPIFCFAGHTDVVPPGDEAKWRHPPFGAVVADNCLHGRGAADMKAALAAMITATESFLGTRPKPSGRIAFLITSDEEGVAINGTRRVVEWLRARQQIPEWCLVGEPSSTAQVADTVKNGRRGSLNGHLVIRGVQGHVAYPHLADNPIHRALTVLDELAKATWDNGNDYFPATSFQISNIRAGDGTTNVIPGHLEVDFNFRFSSEVSAADLQSRVEATLAQSGIGFEVTWQLSGEPFLTPRGPFVEAVLAGIRAHTGIEAELSTGGGTSDGRFIATLGTQVVELGAVNASIHKTDEYIPLADIEKLHTIYLEILRTVFP